MSRRADMLAAAKAALVTGQLGFPGVDAGRGRPRPAPLTPPQREIVRHLSEHGAIRPIDAGRITHEHRQHYPSGLPRCSCRDGVACGWASTDGVDALRRLEARGAVVHRARGVWVKA